MIQRSNPPGLKWGRSRTCSRDRESRNYFCRLNLISFLCKGIKLKSVRGEGKDCTFLFPFICSENFEYEHPNSYFDSNQFYNLNCIRTSDSFL